ncbi:anaerobic ribonucleoside-triphosphate reductase [Marispirochaeta sp.]|jgi:glutaredoxin|uniref:anaerobic ribonucleoside-triphosphate reductase n=1 Tax=Marispirochaeta sp. TaxID=2038653 RepID=UPI0029C6DEAB|nr:anaerobic ribonucleoside-triphosphate reductase [Marispirochaeta sp.]
MKEIIEDTMTLEQINMEIDKLKQEAEKVRGRQTEVYTRIVGYYRAVKNWNRGKREEYKHRRTFEVPEESHLNTEKSSDIRELGKKRAQNSEDRKLTDIAAYQYFYRSTCPNCPPVKAYLAELGFTGSEINVDMDEGFEMAGELAVCATPTVIFRDSSGNELFRSANLQDLVKTFTKERAVS